MKYIDSKLNADKVSLKDVNNNYASENVEGVLEEIDSQIKEIIYKGFVTYKQFGAKLDGVTDDTLAIKKCHEFANENGLTVIQNNSIFVLSDSVDVKTDLDLTGSIVVGKIVDVDTPYYRKKSYYNVIGEELITLNTPSIITKDMMELSLDVTGFLSIEGTEKYIDRILNGITSTEPNWETNYINGNKLTYPIINDHDVSKTVIKYRKDNTPLVIKSPKFKLSYGISKAHSTFNVARNNVTIYYNEVEEIDKNSSEYVPVYTPIYANRCCNLTVNSVKAENLGSSNNTYGISYLVLLEQCCNVTINKPKQGKMGWSGINGNWFRDIKINDGELLTCGGHLLTTDMIISNTKIYNGIEIHGTGILKLDNVDLYNKGISTKLDYAGEFRGKFILNNCRCYNMQRVVYLYPPAGDHGKVSSMPNIEINNLYFEPKIANSSIVYFGYLDALQYDVYLTRRITLKNINVDTTLRHTNVLFSFEINDKNKFKAIDIICDNVNVKDETYLSNEWLGEYSNFIVPKISNNFKYNLQVNNSLCNIGLYSNSINAKIKNSKVVMLRTINGYVAKSSLSDIEFIDCEFIRPYCNFEETQHNIRVKNSIFKKGSDGQIANGIAECIKFASGNIASIDGTIREIDKPKLFNYIDTTYYVNS